MENDFELDTLILEEEMSNNNEGIKLSKVNTEKVKQDEIKELFVPFFYDGKKSERKKPN